MTKCKTCNKKILNQITARGNIRQFCSIACRNKFRTDSSKKSIFVCKWCGVEFIEWTYRKPTFCSNQCRSEYGAHQPKPNARKPESIVTQKCAHCGKEYATKKAQVKFRNGKYCSKKCKYAALSINMRGSNNVNFIRGSTPERGQNWGKQKRAAKKRDKNTCQICGNHGSFFKPLDVHHIKPYRTFNGNYESANRLSNLVTLCRKCHGNVERGKIKLTSFHSYPESRTNN